MIRLNGIGHVLLRVSDVERSRAFYSTILGLKVVEEDPEHKVDELRQYGRRFFFSPKEVEPISEKSDTETNTEFSSRASAIFFRRG